MILFILYFNSVIKKLFFQYCFTTVFQYFNIIVPSEEIAPDKNNLTYRRISLIRDKRAGITSDKRECRIICRD